MPILEWSEILPRVELATPAEFDHAIDTLSARSSADHPTIVALYAHGHQVILGLGLAESFVQIQDERPASKAALVTVGNTKADGDVSFYLLGSHHTEIPRRNLIPIATARQLARAFLFESGKVSAEVAWEPV